jgi:hypothetical protein
MMWRAAAREQPRACDWVKTGLALLVLVQFVLLWQQVGLEAECEVETQSIASHAESVTHAQHERRRGREDAARTAIYAVPTLMRDDDPEMWHVYARHFVSHAAYALTHGYTLVLDTTNYVQLPENQKHKAQATGSSAFVAESNWPFALRAALNSRVRNSSEYDYDWVYMVDVDLMFVNDFARSVDELFVQKFAHYASGAAIQILVAQPFAHRRFGEAVAAYAFLVRNSPDTRWFADMYVNLISGPEAERCGPMTFGDQGYFHVALLKLVMRDRERRGVPVVRGDDDDCFRQCRMPDMPGAELRKGAPQPQAPYAHERYALTLECFENRSEALQLWRGHATFAAQGPVAFSDISVPSTLNRSNAFERFESGVGLNANWAAVLDVAGDAHYNLFDAVAIHSKINLAVTSYADSQPDYVRAARRLFGPVYMPTVRVLLRRMLRSGVRVWRSTDLVADGAAEPSDPDAPLGDAARAARDLGELVLPAARLRRAKPVWHQTPNATAQLSISIHDIAGTMTPQLYRLLETARTYHPVPSWPDDGRGCDAQTPSASDRNSTCRAVHSVGLVRGGPVWAWFWTYGARLPDDLPMPFPNSLIERSLNRQSPLPPGAVWHFSMVSHPALRLLRQWLADRDAQVAVAAQSPDVRRYELYNYAQRDENRDVMVAALTGCQTAPQERACSEVPHERLYHAKAALRHSLTFFGMHEQWRLSARLLEATLRVRRALVRRRRRNERADLLERAQLAATAARRQCRLVGAARRAPQGLHPHRRVRRLGSCGVERVGVPHGRVELSAAPDRATQSAGHGAVQICDRGVSATARFFRDSVQVGA